MWFKEKKMLWHFNKNLVTSINLILLTALFVQSAQASKPMWTFSPLTPTTLAIPPGTTDSVQYLVTNQSSRSKNLVLLPVLGLSQADPCKLNPKGQAGSNCTFTVNINGSLVPAGGIQNGPALCEANPDGSANPNQCYQPSRIDVLHIVKLPQLTIGQPFQGGVVACLKGGKNNLITAVSDASMGANLSWAGGALLSMGATSTTDGAVNTDAIVNCLTNGVGNMGCPGGFFPDSYAAGACSIYQIDTQGNTPCKAGNTCYDDWFLPASNAVPGLPPFYPPGQLDCLQENRDAIGNLSNGGYWSSTENNSTTAWGQIFINGFSATQNMSASARVRCVRYFSP